MPKITKKQVIIEFNKCYPTSKLRFVKYLVNNFKKETGGLKGAKDLTDFHWSKNGGITIAQALIPIKKKHKLNEKTVYFIIKVIVETDLSIKDTIEHLSQESACTITNDEFVKINDTELIEVTTQKPL